MTGTAVTGAEESAALWRGRLFLKKILLNAFKETIHMFYWIIKCTDSQLDLSTYSHNSLKL